MKDNSPSILFCEILEIDVEYNEVDNTGTDDDIPEYLCRTSVMGSKQTYVFDDPEGLVETIFNQYGPYIKFINPTIDKTQYSISFDHVTTFETYAPAKRRSLAPSMGVNTVLVVRITYLGQEPSKSANQLAARFFCTGPRADGVCAAERFASCSHGKLQVVPAVGTDIQNGIVEVSVNRAVSGTHSTNTLVNRVIEGLVDTYGDLESQYQFLSFILPTHNDLRWGDNYKYLAYATLLGFESVYRDLWSVHLDAIVHEWGHNLGLHHSGRNGDPYLDMTGYMGYANGDATGPFKCFNAQKHWLLGWYEDRSTFVNKENLPYMGVMPFFGDYESTKSNEDILLKFQSGNKRLYLQYNLATGINNETSMDANKLVLVGDSLDPDFPYNPKSWFSAALSPGQAYRWAGYYGDHDLIIRVCSEMVPNRLRVSAHIFGLQRDTCREVWEAPTCDDNQDVEFYVTEGLVSKHCGWLSRNFEKWGETLCVPGHAAYELCEETCGKCADDCHDDDSALFFVNNKQGERDCKWLSERPPWQENLCHEDHDAYRLCPESCDVCDRRLEHVK